jgi:hypothetical protein
MNKFMKIVGYKGAWSGEALAAIIRYSITKCRYFVLIVMDERAVEAVELLNQLRPFVDSSALVSAWPGTVKLGGERFEMLKFNATKSSCELLINDVLRALFEKGPPVEDLSLLREDGRPFLVTITHEREAFFKVEPREVHELMEAIGAANLVEEGDDQLPGETY